MRATAGSTLRAQRLVALVLAATSSCSSCEPRDRQSAAEQLPGPGNAFADLAAASGRSVGYVRLRTLRGGTVEAEAELFRLSPGAAYGLSLTSRGACHGTASKAGFGAAGRAEPIDPGGATAIGFRADPEGGARFRFHVALPLAALFDWDGAAVALTTPDGARVACGVVRR